MNKRMNSDTRRCDHCGKDYYRPDWATPAEFARRRFCKPQCSRLYQDARQWGDVRARIKHVLSYEPEIENWQLAERFGMDEEAAIKWRSKLRNRRSA